MEVLFAIAFCARQSFDHSSTSRLLISRLTLLSTLPLLVLACIETGGQLRYWLINFVYGGPGIMMVPRILKVARDSDAAKYLRHSYLSLPQSG